MQDDKKWSKEVDREFWIVGSTLKEQRMVHTNGDDTYSTAVPNDLKEFIADKLAEQRARLREALANNSNPKFWSDADHAVGGYCSKVDVLKAFDETP